MRLCGYCTDNILRSKKSWELHRCFTCLEEGAKLWMSPELTKLEATGQKRGEDPCIFCSTLHEDVNKNAPHLKEHVGPIHRWTIRSLSRIRESLETVVVAFHPLPSLPPAPDGATNKAGLAIRTLYFFPEESLGPWPDPPRIGTSTDPAKNGGAQIRSWLSDCEETHTKCKSLRKNKHGSLRVLPTRLLDIGGPPMSNMKVVETKTTPVRSPYATLSHCWGPKPSFVRLLPTNMKEYIEEDGVPWQLLSKNLREAIEVARFLGIEYIWIDSLCIIQGDGGDFKAEGAKMHSVYRNSCLNIAVADAVDSDGGLFRKRDPNDVVPVKYEPNTHEASGMFGCRPWRVVSSDVYERELLKTSLYLRGWVFQECMLAPRSLHFAKRQVFWDCASLSACESLPFGLPPPMDGPARLDRHWRGRLQEREDKQEPSAGGSDDPLIEFWISAVRKYTNCALTNGGDKLVAIWGIAKLVRDSLGDEYGMGLWEQNLEDQLAWRVAECALEERPTHSVNFPTWSWASMDGRIEIPDRLSKSNTLHWTIKDHDGRDLKFDLVGVKRSFEPPPIRLADASSPTLSRGMSDTIVEQKARNRELEKTSLMRENCPGGKTVIEKVNRNVQPMFYSTSLPMAGNVGRACLRPDPITKGWLLEITGFVVDKIEAYTDTIPKQGSAEDQNLFFVVLSAKQDANPAASDRLTAIKARSIEVLDERPAPREQASINDFDVSGMGILMRNIGDGHFHRTGAFMFHHISKENWERMLEPEKLKFWLD